MKALLWKEGREILPKVLMCLVLCLMIHLMRLRESFAFSFLDSINGWIMAVGLGSATILGVETIASERKSGALAFLKSRPSVVWQVVLAKFSVGSVGLLVVVVPMIGLLSFAEPGQARMEQESTSSINRRVVTGMFGYQDGLEEFKIAVRDVGYGGLMLTTFLLCWMWYGLSLLASSLVDSAGARRSSRLWSVWLPAG